jgi:hypothetical protein
MSGALPTPKKRGPEDIPLPSSEQRGSFSDAKRVSFAAEPEVHSAEKRKEKSSKRKDRSRAMSVAPESRHSDASGSRHRSSSIAPSPRSRPSPELS